LGVSKYLYSDLSSGGWTVANPDGIDSIFVEDSFELGEEISGRRGRNRAGIVDEDYIRRVNSLVKLAINSSRCAFRIDRFDVMAVSLCFDN
jgi:hypothetical protein